MQVGASCASWGGRFSYLHLAWQDNLEPKESSPCFPASVKEAFGFGLPAYVPLRPQTPERVAITRRDAYAGVVAKLGFNPLA